MDINVQQYLKTVQIIQELLLFVYILLLKIVNEFKN